MANKYSSTDNSARVFLPHGDQNKDICLDVRSHTKTVNQGNDPSSSNETESDRASLSGLKGLRIFKLTRPTVPNDIASKDGWLVNGPGVAGLGCVGPHGGTQCRYLFVMTDWNRGIQGLFLLTLKAFS